MIVGWVVLSSQMVIFRVVVLRKIMVVMLAVMSSGVHGNIGGDANDHDDYITKDELSLAFTSVPSTDT